VLSCLRTPVLLRGEPWGYLHVMPGGSPPAVLPYAAERAATFIAIALLNDRVARARTTLRQTALLNRLTNGELTGPEFVRLALTLGTDLRGGPLVAVVLAAGPPGDQRPAAITGAEQADLVVLGLRRRGGFTVLAAEESAHSVLVVGLGTAASGTAASGTAASGTADSETARPGTARPATARPAKRRSAGDVRAALADAGVIAGISDEVAAERARTAIQQARRAFDVAASGIKGPVLAATDLGIYGLLAELAGGTQLARFVEDALGPLMSHDAAVDRGLLPTLSMYVETGFHKAETAERLHIQRRTLYYRLDKIAAALGHDLDSPDSRVMLHVALAGLRLLRARAPGASGTGGG
jgi:purine catabolism regulator